MKKVWNKELDSYLKANYMQLSAKMISKKINFKFGITVTPGAIRNRKIVLGLKSGRKFPIKYTDEVIEYIVKNYKGKDNIELAIELKEKFNIDTNNDNVGMLKANLKRRYGINLQSGINRGCIKKGNIPINKGTKGMFNVGGNSGSFKKGNKPKNYRPVGTERIGKDNYLEIKYLDPNKWEGKHRYLYKKYYGEIPKDHIVIFADGNIRNFEKENLIAITKNENARLNQNKLRFEDSDMTKTAINIAKLIIKTSGVTNAKEKL